MNKKLLTLALTMAITSHCFADDAPTLKISKSGGEDNIALSELLSIKYTETDMIVNMKDGTKQTIALDDIIVMELGQTSPTAIYSIFPGCNSNATYILTDINGKVIAKGKVNDGISLPNQKGIYIISVGETSKKVLVK